MGLLRTIARPLPAGVRAATRVLFDEIAIAMKHRRGVRQARRLSPVSGLRVQLGSGGRRKDGWINIDLAPSADLTLDLRRPLPLPDNCCAVIYSEHFLEHIAYPEPIRSLLCECRRILTPGGLFSAAVPDSGLVLRSYVDGGTDEYYDAQRKWNPAWCRSQMEHVNYNFRQAGEHQFAYDYETMETLLTSCGFAAVRRRPFDPELDSEDRLVGSLYVDCSKPGGSVRMSKRDAIVEAPPVLEPVRG